MSGLHFTHNLSTWHVIVYLLITAVLLYWEYKKGKSWVNHVVVTLLTLCLLLIYLRPAIQVLKPLQSIFLIGEGKSQLADSLSSQRKYPVFKQSTDTVSGISTFVLQTSKQAIELSDWEKQPDTIFSVGYIPHRPLDYNHWKQLTSFIPYTLSYNRNIKLGDTLKVGIANQSTRAINVTIAVASETPKDKLLLPERSLFVENTPKVVGNYQSRIALNDTIAYNINTLVEEDEALLVYLLAGTPDFEWKFLNDFLGSRGHSILWKTKVSTDKFKEQTTNWPDSMRSTVMKASLDKYDLIITDEQAWNDLTYSKQKEVLKVVTEGKGTLIFRANENTKLKDKTATLPFDVRAGQLIKSAKLSYINILNSSDWQKFNDYQYYNKEIGSRIGLVTLQNSYLWLLAGKKVEYNEFWDNFFNELLLTEKNGFTFHDALAFQKHPFRITQWTANQATDLRIIQPQGDTLSISATKASLMSEREAFIFYPQTIGWHTIVVEAGYNIPFYAHPISLAKEAMGQAFYQYNYKQGLMKQQNGAAINAIFTNEQDVTIWFFVLLLMCLGYLWIEEKLN